MLPDYVNMEHMKNAIDAIFNRLNFRLSEKSGLVNILILSML